MTGPRTEAELPNFGLQYLHGSHLGPQPPAACRDCGRPMRLYETRGYWRVAEPSFDSNGKPNIVRYAECSAPWVKRLWGFHDHAVQDSNGDWPWV
jgi:hypothetical protein